MKIAVLFSLVVLVLVAFLKPASGCDCVKYLTCCKKEGLNPLTQGVMIPPRLFKKGPKVACKKAGKAVLAKIKTQPCFC